MKGGEVSWGLIFTVILATAGGSFQMFNISILNQAQPIMQAWIGRTISERSNTTASQADVTLLYSLTSSAISLGGIVGSLLTRILADRYGRRGALIINGAIGVLGAILSGASKFLKSPEALIIGRLILGINTGAASGLVPLYITECASVKYRGAFGSVHQLMVSFADFISLVIGLPEFLGGENTWPAAVSLSGIPALALCLLLPFCAESPRYLLITKGDKEKAEESVKFFCGTEKLREHLKNLSREAAFAQLYTGGHSFIGIRSLFQMREVRTPLFISVLVMCGQQFTGCASVFSYSTDMFVSAGLSLDDARLSTVGVGAGYFVFTVPAIYLIEKLGRRRLSLFQLTGCLVSLIFMSTLTGLRQAYPGVLGYSYGTIAALSIYMCIYGLGSPIPWIMASELFDQKFRSTAVTINTLVSWTLAFAVSLLYLPFERAVGSALSYLPFMIVLTAIIVLMFLFLPETKNKSIDAIVGEFRRRRSTVSRTVLIHPAGTSDDGMSKASGRKSTSGYGTSGGPGRSRVSVVSVMSDISEADANDERSPLLRPD